MKKVKYHLLERQKFSYHIKQFYYFLLLGVLWIARYVFNPKCDVNSSFYQFYFKTISKIAIPITEYEMFLNSLREESEILEEDKREAKKIDKIVDKMTKSKKPIIWN
jgi:hypothetical protein